MANMAGAFFGKASDGKQLFQGLQIAGFEGYQSHLNQHNVIYIDFSKVPEKCSSYDEYIARILKGLKEDLCRAYPDADIDGEYAVWDMLTDIFQKTGEKFIFVMDEWDAVFHMPFIMEEERKESRLKFKAMPRFP